MGDIGPIQKQYEVMPGQAFGIDDADAWTVPSPEPMPTPDPGPSPGPEPIPNPDPTMKRDTKQ